MPMIDRKIARPPTMRIRAAACSSARLSTQAMFGCSTWPAASTAMMPWAWVEKAIPMTVSRLIALSWSTCRVLVTAAFQ